jgi:cyclohexane-1-carbonyl-CoA dehydrogenase
MNPLSEDQKILLDSVKRAARDKIAPAAACADREGRLQPEVVPLLWDLGLFQIMLPEEFGGWTDRPCHTLCLSTEEIAKFCASSALLLIIQAVGSFPLLKAGDPEQKQRLLPRISEGRELMAYLVTEPDAGSDVQALSGRAERSRSGYILNGRKVFATNGAMASLYSVLLKTAKKELSFFVVDRNTPGLHIGKVEDKCGFRGSNTAEVLIEDVSVPPDRLLGAPGDGFAIAMADFDMSRPCVAALALGIAEGAFTHAVAYAKQRITFGRSILKHQGVQFMLADAWMKIEAGRGLMEKAALLHDEGRPNTVEASMAKCFCSDSAMSVTTDMVQVLGGYGYIRDYPLERMFRDAKLTQIFEGTNQIQRMIIGKELTRR